MPNDAGRSVRRCAASLGILGVCALGTSAEQPGPYEPPVMNETSAAVRTPETAIRDWPERSYGAARALISKYGEPNGFDDDSLVWYDNVPWQKTVVRREGILEQTIACRVPSGKIGALKRFDPRLDYDPAAGELTSRAGSEALNDLALNLAGEIVSGKREAGEARAFSRKTMKLSESGKSSPYMNGLLFPPGRSGSPAPLK